jgi:hypothetical protein
VSSLTAGLDPEHRGQPLCRLHLSDVAEIRSQAHYVAAARAAYREVGPTTSAGVDAERAWSMIDTTRIEDYIFGTFSAAAGKPASQ